MKLIDQYYKPHTYDSYTFVFDEVTPETGYHTMLALSEDGYAFSQWTSGIYDPDSDNEHLGQRVLLHELGTTVLNGFFSRLSIPKEWEELHSVIEDVVRDMSAESGDEPPSALERFLDKADMPQE